MKKLIYTTLLVSGLSGVFAPAASAQQDTAQNKEVRMKARISAVGITIGTRDSTKKVESSKGRFIGGVTFTRLDIGYTRLVDNGSFTLSPQNDFLDYRAGKTSIVSFDVVQMGYRFNPNFKIYVAGGFDWTHIRLEKNITIQKNQQQLTYVEDDVHFSKNRFSSSYVHFPLNFELRTKENDKGKRFYFIVGPELSFLLNGKVKQVSEERGKEKFRDDYRFQAVRYSGTARFGYGGFGLFTKYYFNDMFASTPQEGLTNMAFGITFGLN
jgi:opacity protein-like surface antigen